MIRRTRVTAGAALAVSGLLALGGCFPRREDGYYAPVASDLSAEEAQKRSEAADAAFAPPRTPQSVEKSLEAALSGVSPHNGHRALWQAARATEWLAERHPDPAKREDFASRGVALGHQAVRLAPDRVESHYYLALNLGRLSGIQRTKSYIQEMAREADAALARDERYDRAGAHRFLGTLHLRTQGKLFVGFGDLDLALHHLARAAELFPNDPENRVAYAEALIEDERYEDARRELDKAASLPVPPELVGEEKDWTDRAVKLRAQLPKK